MPIIGKLLFYLLFYCRVVHKKKKTQPLLGQYLHSGRAPTQSEGTGGVWGSVRLTAVPERMLKDDGWPSRYVVS